MLTGGALYAVLAVAVALFGVWTATDLFRRVYANVGRARDAWLTAAALALALSMWAMHVIFMLGEEVGAADSFDGSVLLLALAVAADSSRLYVANADNNDVAVVDIHDPARSTVLGFIPTGWSATPC